MGGLATLLTQLGAGVTGALSNQIGYGLGELTGYNDAIANRQLDQQQKLTTMQYNANYGLMKNSYDMQRQLWEDTSAPAQMEQLKKAGLNPALMYSKGGTGGSTGGGGASVGGGQASDESNRMRANTESTIAGMALQKLASEIDVNKSVAERNRAEAQTTGETRPWIVEKLKQEGRGQWIDNVREKYMLEYQSGDVRNYTNKTTGETLTPGDIFTSQMATDLALTIAQTDNTISQKLLNDKKALYYFQEILNDTARADYAGVQAAAQKLAADFNFGDLYNEKWWIQLGQDVTGQILNGIGKFRPGTTIQNTKNIFHKTQVIP